MVPLTTMAQSNSLDWTQYEIGAPDEWDFVDEIDGSDDDSISRIFDDVDASGIDVTAQFDVVRGSVDTRSEDGTFLNRESLDLMLNRDPEATGIFEYYTYPGGPGATLNFGYGESDRDDSVVLNFAFSTPALDVSFDAIDVDKSKFSGALGSEICTRANLKGWIDQLTITGYFKGQPVYPVFGTIPSGSNTPANNPYSGEPNPNDYVLVKGANSNILEGRWEFLPDARFGQQPDDGGNWNSDQTYGADQSVVAVSFPSVIDSFTVHYENAWSVPGNDDRTNPDEYWGSHRFEVGISDIGFTPYVCSVAFTDGAGGEPGYLVGDPVFLSVEDLASNSDPGAADSLTVTLTNDRSGESEQVLLTETGPDTNVFTNATGFPTTVSGSTGNDDGVLNVQETDSVTATWATGGTGGIGTDVYIFPVGAAIVKSVNQARASEGDTLTYSLDPGYPAGDELTNVTVTDSVPAGTTYVGGSATAGGSEAGGVVTWLLGSTVAGGPNSVAGGLGSFSAFDDLTNDFGWANSTHPAMVADSSGNLHVLFKGASPTASDINIYYTNNIGGSWSAPLLLSSDGDSKDATDADLAVDASGTVHVVLVDKPKKGWADPNNNDSEYNVYYRSVSAGAASAPLRLSDSGLTDAKMAKIAVEPGGKAHVVFLDRALTVWSGLVVDIQENAYYMTVESGVAGAPLRLSDDTDLQNATAPDVAVDASGTAHLVFADRSTAVFSGEAGIDLQRNVYYRSVTGTTPSAPQRLSDDTDGQDAFRPVIAIDGAGTAHVVFTDTGGAVLDLLYTENSGGGFGAPTNMTGGFSGFFSDYANLAVDALGSVHVVFENFGAGGFTDVFYITNVTGSFVSTAITDDLGAQYSWWPDLAVTPSRVEIVFEGRDLGASQRNIYHTCADLRLVATDVSVSALPGIVTTGDTVTVTVELTASKELTGVLPTLIPAGTNNMDVSLLSAPPAQNLTADVPAQFVWTYAVTEGTSATPGQLTFEAAAVNSGATFGIVDFGTADSNSLIATPPLEFQVTVDAGAATPVSNTASLSDTSGNIPPTGSNQVKTVIGNILGDFVWNDTDGNGVQDGGELGLNGVTVKLLTDAGAPTPFTTTTANNGTKDGAYQFDGVPDGFYIIEFIAPAGYVFSPPNNAAYNIDSDADPADGRSHDFFTGPTETILTIDAGLFQPNEISGFVYFDNGAGNQPLAGVTLNLLDQFGAPVLDAGSLPITALSSAAGSYSFPGLAPGSYQVSQDQPSGYQSLSDTDGANNNLIGDETPILVSAGATSPGHNFIEEQFGAVAGTVTADIDNDDFGDLPIGSVTLTLKDNLGGDIDSDLITPGMQPTTALTMPDGSYTFSNLLAGDYQVVQTQPAGFSSVWDSDGSNNNVIGDQNPIGVTAGGTNLANHFVEEEFASIGDLVWADINGNGIRDGADTGVPNIGVRLLDADASNAELATTVSDGSGLYLFDQLAPGNYVIGFVPPAGYKLTLQDQVGTEETDSDPDPITGETAAIAIAAGDNVVDIDAGVIIDYGTGAAIGNSVWLDEDGNAVRNAGEEGIAGVQMELLDEVGAIIATTTTDADGGYVFAGVAIAVTRTVRVNTATLPAGLTNLTADPDATLDGQHSVTLAQNQESMAADFAYNYAPPADTGPAPSPGASGAIGNRVWNDADADGRRDPGEAGIGGVEVKLFNDPDGNGVYDNLIASTTSSAAGHYAFDAVPPGSYRIEATPPAGYTQTGDPDATLDNATSSPLILAPGDVYLNADFGYVLDSGGAAIGDTIYLDVNADGWYHPGTDVGIPNITVALLDAGGEVIATDTSDADGKYRFPGLPVGVAYTVRVTDTDHVLTGVVQTGDPDATIDGQSTIASLVAPSNLIQDFGYTPFGHFPGAGLIGGTVFLDTDADETLSGDEGTEAVAVELYDAAGTALITSTITDESGQYRFAGLDPAATYTVRIDDTGVLEGTYNTIDPDTPVFGDLDSQVDLAASGGTDLVQDFGFLGYFYWIEGTLWLDADADGTIDAAEAAGLAGVTVDILDSIGNVLSRARTAADGSYLIFGFPTGDFTIEVSDRDRLLDGYWHTIGADSAAEPALVTIGGAPGFKRRDFGYYVAPASVGNYIFEDVDSNGIQSLPDTPLGGVVVKLQVIHPNGDIVRATTISAADGSYSFDNLLLDEDHIDAGGPGQPSLVLTAKAPAGFGPTLSNIALDNIDSDNSASGEYAAVVQGGSDPTNDFGFATDSDGDHIADVIEGIGDRDGDGVSNHLDYDPAGYFYDKLTGEIIPGGSVLVTGPGQITLELDGSTGQYKWLTDSTPGTYTMVVTPPAGYAVDTDLLGGTLTPNPVPPNPDSFGSGEAGSTGFLSDPTPTTFYLSFDLSPGDPEIINNNIPLLFDKPGSWSEWLAANAGGLGAETAPSGNNDGDFYDNLLEFALCLHPGSGASNLVTDPGARGGFKLEKSGSGTLDALFTRPLGGFTDLTYTVEVTAAIGPTTNWSDITSGIAPSFTDNGDGTETVRYADLELLDGTTAEGIDLSSGMGFARLRVDLNDGTTTAVSHTEVSGWCLYSAQAEAETCSIPFLHPDVFSGAVKADASGVLDVSDSAGTGPRGVSAQMAARPHYIEIIAGTFEGHRFEVASATDQSITLEIGAARNTLDPIPDLTGAAFTLRTHYVPDDIADPADFVDLLVPSNNNDPATAGRLLFYSDIYGWLTYFAYDAAGGITPQWTSADNSYLENIGDALLDSGNDEFVVIDPGVGMFAHPKAHAVDILMLGEVRSWAFACPMTPSYNLVGSAYPLDQSPDSRDMSLNYFTGSPDPSTADQVEFWLSDDATFGVAAYESHFRVLSGSSYDFWTTQEGSSLPDEDGLDLFKIQRASFINSVNGCDKSIPASVWLWPVPWSP